MPGFIVNPFSGHIWTLRYGLTTIGSLNCDILINDGHADQQHAVVQYNEQSGDFCIRDLNSLNGIFLNSSNFRNATSPLCHGDTIAFSENGQSFVFCVSQSPNDALLFVQTIQQSGQKGDLLLPVIPNLPIAPQPQTTLAFGNDLALKDRWAVQTQGGAWTQIAPIPPPKPPAYNLRGRPSSASSVSRLVRQPAIVPQPPPRGQAVTQGSFIRSGGQIIVTAPSSNPQTPPQSQIGTTGTTISAEVVESLARHINSRSNSGDNSVNLNETFNVDPTSSFHARIAELESENRMLSEQLQSVRADSAHKDTRIASLHAAVESVQDMIKERERQMLDMKNKMDSAQRLKDENVELKTEELERLRHNLFTTEREAQDAREKLVTCETENELLKEEMESLRREMENNQNSVQENRKMQQEHEKVVNDLNSKLESLHQTLNQLQEKCDVSDIDGVSTYIDQLASSKSEQEAELNNHVNKLLVLESEIEFLITKVEASGTDMETFSTLFQSAEGAPETPQGIKLKHTLELFMSSIVTNMQNGSGNPTSDVIACFRENGVELDDSSQSDVIVPKLTDVFNSVNSLKDELAFLKESYDAVVKEKESMVPSFDVTIQLEALKTEMETQKQLELEELVKCKLELQSVREDQSVLIQSSKQENEEAFNAWKLEVTTIHDQQLAQLTGEKEKEVYQLKEQHSKDLSRLEEEHSAKLCDLQSNIAELSTNINDLQGNVTANETTIAQLRKSLESVSQEKEAFQSEIHVLFGQKSALEDLIKEKDLQLQESEEQQGRDRESEESYRMLKLECQEHAKTIVKLEEKIIALSQENDDNVKLKEKAMVEKEEIIAKYTREKPKIPPKPASITPVRTMEDLHALEQLVVLLRTELSEAKKQLKENEVVIEGLTRDLAGANARLNDVAGELSESQKEEVERSQALVRDLEVQLASIKVQVDKGLSERDAMAKENDQFKQDLMTSKHLVDQLKKDAEVKNGQLSEMKRQLFEQIQVNERQEAIQKEQNKIAEELSGMGAQCKGERHLQVMQRQKEALSDLRHRIKLLEQNRPPIPTADQALGQVALLQRELAELKAQQAAGVGVSQDIPGLDIDDEDFMDPDSGEVKKARGKIETALLKANRVENAEALELSEKSYFSLTKSLSRRMGLEGLGGNRTMAHISRDEREKLFVEREKDIEQINSNVGALQSRVERKDELLNTYEKDLSKLREMEAIAAQKQKEVLKANADLRAKKEEIEFIREALKRTKEDYEREKRLNVAIKSKKGEFLEQFEKQSKGSGLIKGGGGGGHSCVPEDVMGKEAKKKREENEKLKKKSYEVDRLKELLKEKDNTISELSVKIVNYESTAEAH